MFLNSLWLNWGSPHSLNQMPVSGQPSPPTPASVPHEGLRLQLNYQQWLDILSQEAQSAATKAPPRLTILAGDSLSLWFPIDLLPTSQNWLNQGISGETSYGLLRRLRLFDQARPERILVMIGINDLIQGVRDATLLANYQEIIQHLKQAHPRTTIIVQSILPHGADRWQQPTDQPNLPDPPLWVKRLQQVPNSHIRDLNRQLAEIAEIEGVIYLDLHSKFTDINGDLLPHLSTDGLHLSHQGYQVWKAQLETIPFSTQITPTSRRSP